MPLVLAAATATFFVNTIHATRTSKFRKASGVKYPNAYASAEQAEKDPSAYRFNCAQRAHANFTENHTSFLGALLVAGLRYPFPAAILGASWGLSRVIYLFGYTSSAGPKGREMYVAHQRRLHCHFNPFTDVRSSGAVGSALSDIALKLTAAYTSAMLVLGQ
ncbi:MAPEG family protein [Purpureocillium lavendulum]|uniref:MAPEG family protein n=1 Tax=Purpureocillium lavendulum TaxID=1247861 RepID=A0AB34G0U9_9HYPO|nr:MAPEG family protein [Purpureocillium lavendulum]